ncbi:DNA primase DnaG [Azospirillum argentinense]|uniref:CHC2 zinc finger domain-containing protein n=1 Tax=Azospirillum argentinense TaxID=2970906 RepID=UPI003D814079
MSAFHSVPSALASVARACGVDLSEISVNGAAAWKACCPFHQEKTPSFYVYQDDRFRCLGCGAAGDGREFVRLMGVAGYVGSNLSPHAPHPSYGPCDAFGPEGTCAECTGLVERHDGTVATLTKEGWLIACASQFADANNQPGNVIGHLLPAAAAWDECLKHQGSELAVLANCPPAAAADECMKFGEGA